MTAAAIAGVFTTYRHVPSRGCVQLVIEIPVEAQAAAFEALGYPEPGKSLHVAVARLRDHGERDTVSLAAVAVAHDGRDMREQQAPAAPHQTPAESEVMPVEGPRDQSRSFDTPPSPPVAAGAQGSLGDVRRSARSGTSLTSPVAPEGDENRGTSNTDIGDGQSESANLVSGRVVPSDGVSGRYERALAAKAAYANGTPGERAVTRAALLCKDPQFQGWVAAATNRFDCDETGAADYLRAYSGISSRAELANNPDALAMFKALVTEYDIWRGALPEQRR